MVKQCDAKGKLTGIEVRVIYGDDTTLAHTGTRTIYVERTLLCPPQKCTRQSETI